MRVTIDIQAAIAQRAGVGRYTKLLVEHLGPLAAGDELGLFYFDFQRKGIHFPVAGARQKAVRWCPGRFVQKAWKTLNFPPFDWFAGVADVYHFPNFIRPPLTRGKSVVTIHDVSFLRFPETTEERNLRYLTAQIRRTAELADAIVTDSEFVAREIGDLLGTARNKIFPIHLGLSTSMARPSTEAIADARKALELQRPYLLMVGTIEPRKNIPFLIDVFERLDSFDGNLVIAGMRGWKYEPILDRMRNSPKAARIRHLDYVEESLLPGLYAGAELFVFPSLYEGFGFTPLEAMACGTPVLSSKTGSLPEVLGDAAMFVDSFDADAWAAQVSRLLADTVRKTDLVSRGLRQAGRFRWETAAAETWKIYRRLA